MNTPYPYMSHLLHTSPSFGRLQEASGGKVPVIKVSSTARVFLKHVRFPGYAVSAVHGNEKALALFHNCLT